MATITPSGISPTTGPQTGGTTVTVSGTNLDSTTRVLVGDVPATIIGTPTGTALVFKTPASTTAAAKNVRLLDASSQDVNAGSFTYAAVATPEALVSTVARKMRLDVNTGTSTSPTWTKVRGITQFQPSIDTTTQDDSDYDSGVWGSDAKTQLKWQLQITCKRGLGQSSGNYDAGQEALRATHDVVGAGSTLQVRWYDRNGGPEAYTGYGMVQWAPQGGDTTALDTVQITIMGQGTRTVIANPVLADPSLAA